MRKFITFLLVGLVFSPLTLATSKNQAVSDLVSRGIIREKTDHRLEDPLLRQELIGMLMSGMFGGLGNACLGYYDDVSASFPNTWICPVVEAAADK